MEVPNSSPRASVGGPVRILHMLTLADGTFFPLVAGAIPWCRASGPAGLAPEALQERGCAYKGFYTGSAGVRSVSFNRHRQYFSRPRRCHTHASGIVCVRCALGGIAVRRAPVPGPVQGGRGELFDVFYTLPRRPSVGQRVRFLQPPSNGSRIADSSLSCDQVIQVDAHAPFDKGWLVVWGLIHESAYVGLLGGSRSRSLGTEGAEALPRWDPPTSYPRWLLNTTCGAPSSW
jgi:hypothetical protein